MKNTKNVALSMLLIKVQNAPECVGPKEPSKFSWKPENALESVKFLT